MFLYPNVIAPLFNKYDELKPGELQQQIEELANRMKFPLKRVYVVDASKRSSHSNAFLYGFGGNKRIVLFDTILNSPNDQIIAILCNSNHIHRPRIRTLEAHAHL
jgi:STE24 endopeptidase